ncbi:fumarate/nitrate reduction transcriptional regulator Fnr [Massilia sp. CCM 9210]|uniref:fumarate/nitrate reduction transcriptional regulator Fnr n=1 Tax=Massilia scottii TaxID=3057166 RepID=UPI002796C1D1|nr:fumarate/nitrate reduction transcriptional regulator Fnr [Massilia sp. CCM 9210]MDQ1812346.1 fumarate/nitrate reduction transcriptional regulator Fnr [Massilia sp. CCM 9210]
MKTAIHLSPVPLSIGRTQIKCTSCAMNKLCLPTGLDESDTGRLDKIILRRRRVDRGESLFAMGASFKNLYAIRCGHFKTFRINRNGEQQVVGFHMAGDVLGLDAIGTERHQSGAVALEDSEICEIPFARLEELFTELPQLQRHFHRVMSNEITRDQSAMMFLGGMRAEQRFAIFLLNLAARYAARGYSGTVFQLRMSREEIGNYLGLTVESVSRLLLRFKQKGWLRVALREVELLDRASMEAVASGQACAEPIATKRRLPCAGSSAGSAFAAAA